MRGNNIVKMQNQQYAATFTDLKVCFIIILQNDWRICTYDLIREKIAS